MALIYARIESAVLTNGGQRKAMFGFFLPERVFCLSFFSAVDFEHDTKMTHFCIMGLRESDEAALRLVFKLEARAGVWNGSS